MEDIVENFVLDTITPFYLVPIVWMSKVSFNQSRTS